MAYYTLLVKWAREDLLWEIHFGDRERELVETELSVLKDGDAAYDYKILKTKTDNQAEINRAVKLINDAEMGVLPDPPRPQYPGYLEAKDMVSLLGIMSAIVRAGDVREIRSNGDCVIVAADLLDIVIARVNRACGWTD